MKKKKKENKKGKKWTTIAHNPSKWLIGWQEDELPSMNNEEKKEIKPSGK